jgi:carbohydrate-selective porin OprB
MVRLTQLWIQHQIFDNKLDVKAGYFGEGEDFNTFPCDFQNLAFCGSQVGNWATNIWYNWPVSQAAIRVKYNITPSSTRRSARTTRTRRSWSTATASSSAAAAPRAP